MKKNFSIKANRKLLLCFIAILYMLFIVSCGNNKDIKSKSDNCITMTRTQVQAWLQTGWPIPGNSNFVPYLFFTPIPGSNIKVDVYPTDKDDVVQYGKRLPMKISSMSPPCSFPAGLKIVPNYYDFSKEGFTDASGNLIPFDFLRLRPKPCPDNTAYMNFDVEIVTSSGGTEIVTAKGETKPCPPYCPTE